MSKAIYQLPKKLAHDDVDSADELDASFDEMDVLSNKIPQSNIKHNPNKFSGDPRLQHQEAKDRSISPLRIKNTNHVVPKFQLGNDDNEVSKKGMYKSPKDALANQTQYQSNKPKNKGSPSREKNYPPSFEINISNKENAGQEDLDYYQSREQGPSPYTDLANQIYNKRFQTNPHPRQTNIGKTNNTDLLLSPNEAQAIKERREFASRDRQKDVVDRLLKQGDIIMEHQKELTNATLGKEFEECTFAPGIKSTKPRRNFEEFLEDQKRFQHQVNMKNKKLQEKITIERSREDGSYTPTLCQNSVKLLEKKRQQREPAYQRLYSLGKNAQMKHMKGLAENSDLYSHSESAESSHFIGDLSTDYKGKDTPKFVPNIHKKSKNIKREERIDDLLYNDALRRQHKIIEASKMQSKSTSGAQMSLASKRALAIRFIKEFDIAILEFLEMGKEPKLNYIKLNEFLKKLCFLKESEQIENPHFTPERLLLYDLWYTLQADKYGGVHRRNLLVFLLGLMSLHFPITKIQNVPSEEIQSERKDHEEDEEGNDVSPSKPMLDRNKNPILPGSEGQQSRERRILGSFDENGNYELTEEEVRKVHKVYELWYLNRLCSADNLGQLASMRNQQEYSYQPEINEASRNLAQNYREKMLEGTAELIQQNKIPAPKDGKITHADLLIVSKKVLEEKVNRYGEIIREEQSKDCTFKPQTTQYDHTSYSSTMRTGQNDVSEGESQSRKQKGTPVDALGRDRVFELYSLAKPRILKKDKDPLEVDYEKNGEECTFQPSINREFKSPTAEPNEFFAKGIEKTIGRLREARAEKEQQLQQLNRGFTNGNERDFVFTLDKKKHKKDTLPIHRKPNKKRFSPTNNGVSPHLNRPGTSNNPAHQMMGDGSQEKKEYYNYGEHEQGYRNHAYGIEPDHGLNEVQEEENETGDHSHLNDQKYEGEARGQPNNGMEQPRFQRDGEENVEGNERIPLLFVDVNLGQGRSERIVVYEGDKSEVLAAKFAEEHGLDPSMKEKLKELLDSHIASLLSQIDEELNSGISETDRAHHNDHYMHDQIQEEDDYVEEESYGER